MSVVQSKRGEEQVDACFTSWKAHAEQGDTYNLVRKMTTFYQELWR